MTGPVRLHATCVAVDGVGVLIRGPSGGGKSDLALRLIDDGARLVADDQVLIEAAAGRLVARAPETLRDRIEVRGIGIVAVAALDSAPVGLVVDLAPSAAIERLPAPARATIAGIAVPLVRIAPFEASAAAKVRLAVRIASGNSMAPS